MISLVSHLGQPLLAFFRAVPSPYINTNARFHHSCNKRAMHMQTQTRSGWLPLRQSRIPASQTSLLLRLGSSCIDDVALKLRLRFQTSMSQQCRYS